MIGIWPAVAIALLAALVLLGFVAGSQVVWIMVLILALICCLATSYPYWGTLARRP